MQALVVITALTIARRILDHLGLDSTRSSITGRAQGSPELYEPDPDYDVPGAVYSD